MAAVHDQIFVADRLAGEKGCQDRASGPRSAPDLNGHQDFHLLADEDVARFDEHRHGVACFEPELGNSLLGDAGRDEMTSANIDFHGSVDRAWCHSDNLSRELIARADFHVRLPSQIWRRCFSRAVSLNE